MYWLPIIRPLMRTANAVRRFIWRVRGATIYGVMVVAYTAEGQLILVKQTYADGWSLPGGGMGRSENCVQAALRELQEEVGATRWTTVTELQSSEHSFDGVKAVMCLVRVDCVEFVFKKNLEIESVETFQMENIPDDLNRWSAKFIDMAMPKSKIS